MKLWPRALVIQFAETGSVHELTAFSSDQEVDAALAWTLDVCQVVPVWERARIYTEVVDHLQSVGLDVPDVFTERMFESEIYASRPTGGERGRTEPQEGSSVRETGREVAPGGAGPGGLLEADRRDPAGQLGRRPRQIGVRSDPAPGEEGGGTEPLEGDPGG